MFCTVVLIVASVVYVDITVLSSSSVVLQDMQHPNFETQHPLQQDEQETGYDPLQTYNRNRDRNIPNRSTFKLET